MIFGKLDSKILLTVVVVGSGTWFVAAATSDFPKEIIFEVKYRPEGA